jgi:hypothetical protein
MIIIIIILLFLLLLLLLFLLTLLLCIYIYYDVLICNQPWARRFRWNQPSRGIPMLSCNNPYWTRRYHPPAWPARCYPSNYWIMSLTYPWAKKDYKRSDSTSGDMVFYVLLSILVMWFQCGEIPRKYDSTIFQANAHIKTGYATHPNLQSAFTKNTDNPRYSNSSALFRTCCQLVQQVSSNRYPYPRYPRMMIA